MTVRAVHTWSCDRCDASAPPNHRDDRPDDWRSLGGHDVCGDCWASYARWWESWEPGRVDEEKVRAFIAGVDAKAPAPVEEP
jgi:hypothetical protein